MRMIGEKDRRGDDKNVADEEMMSVNNFWKKFLCHTQSTGFNQIHVNMKTME